MKIFGLNISSSKTKAVSDSFPEAGSIGKGSNLGASELYSFVYDNIRAVAKYCATVEPIILINGEENDNHPLTQLLATPNADQSRYMFFEYVYSTRLLSANTYIRVLKDADTGILVGLEVLDESSVNVKTENNEIVYTVIIGNKQVVIPADEMINIHSFNPDSNVIGYSPAQAVAQHVALSDAVTTFQSAVFANGGTPAGVVGVNAKPEEFENVKAQVKKGLMGAMNGNKLLYVRTDGDTSPITVTSMSQQTAELATGVNGLYENITKKVDKSFGVPAEIKGDVKNSTYASASVAERLFYQNVVVPEVYAVMDSLTHFFNRMFDEKILITFDDPTPESSEEKKLVAETEKIEVDTLKVRTEVYANLLNAGMVESKAMLIAGLVEEETDIKTAGGVVSKGFCCDIKSTVKDEERLQKAIDDVLAKQLKRVLNSLDSKVKAVNNFFDVEIETKLMTDAVLPIVYELGLEAQGRVIAGVESQLDDSELPKVLSVAEGLSVAFEISSQQYLNKLFSGFNEFTNKGVAELVQAGLVENLTVAEIRKNIKHYYSTEISYRANMVAVTEVNRWYNEAGLESAKEIQTLLGKTISKTWVTRSNNPCEFCQAMAGTKIPITDTFLIKGDTIEGVNGGAFDVDYLDLSTPDLHPHCRCEYILTVER